MARHTHGGILCQASGNAMYRPRNCISPFIGTTPIASWKHRISGPYSGRWRWNAIAKRPGASCKSSIRFSARPSSQDGSGTILPLDFGEPFEAVCKTRDQEKADMESRQAHGPGARDLPGVYPRAGNPVSLTDFLREQQAEEQLSFQIHICS